MIPCLRLIWDNIWCKRKRLNFRFFSFILYDIMYYWNFFYSIQKFQPKEIISERDSKLGINMKKFNFQVHCFHLNYQTILTEFDLVYHKKETANLWMLSRILYRPSELYNSISPLLITKSAIIEKFRRVNGRITERTGVKWASFSKLPLCTRYSVLID